MKTQPRIIVFFAWLGLLALCSIGNIAAGVEMSPKGIEDQPCAQYEQGMMLLNSREDALPDLAKVADLFLKAAYANEPRAQYALGTLYLRGWGVPRNAALAYAWVALSAEPGDERTKKALKGLRKQLSKSDLRLAKEKMREISAILPASRAQCSPSSR